MKKWPQNLFDLGQNLFDLGLFFVVEILLFELQGGEFFIF